jgi:hypothetical protein
MTSIELIAVTTAVIRVPCVHVTRIRVSLDLVIGLPRRGRPLFAIFAR